MKKLGVDRVSYVAEYGFAADEIISFARKTPDNLIAMCTHGRLGRETLGVGQRDGNRRASFR